MNIVVCYLSLKLNRYEYERSGMFKAGIAVVVFFSLVLTDGCAGAEKGEPQTPVPVAKKRGKPQG